MSTQASDNCLDWEQLEAVLSKDEPDPALAKHLDACSDCRERFGELRANNQMMRDVVAAARSRTTGLEGLAAVRPKTPVNISGYELVREIRHGGQGIVYEAVQRATRRTVAVKVLLEGRLAVPARRRRFEREIEVVAALRHPFIVTVYDSGLTADGRLFFSMEYVDGLPLDEYVSQRAAASADASGSAILPHKDALSLFCDICEGVNHAHQRGVIHRDLKPSNILIGADDRPHIVDFGLAKAVHDDPAIPQASLVTAAGQFMGTLAYAAPEQLRGDPNAVDVRTDVYALGVILYELLTGRLPYPAGSTLSETIWAITDTDPPAPSSVLPFSVRRGGPPIGNELDTIVLKALAKGPQRRYQTAGALAEDIRRYQRGEPIDARRDSSWYVLRKTIRRYRWSAGVAATFVVLLIAFSVGMSLMYRRTLLEAEKAKQIKVFLEDTLGSVEPPRLGAEATVRQILDEAVHWVEIALRGQPEVEASLRTTIGNSYRSLGLFDRADRELTLALEIHRRLFGEEHALVAQSVNALGALARDRGDYDDAVDLFRRGLEMRRRLLGDQHLDVSMSLQNLASVCVRQGDLTSAEGLLRESLAIRRRLFHEPHPDVAMAQFQLAEVLRGESALVEAEELHRAALKARQALLHEKHPDLGRSLVALGQTLSAGGRWEEAEPFLRECVDRQTAAAPDDPLRLAEANGELGSCLTFLRRFEEAEPLLVRSYDGLRETTGGESPSAAVARWRLLALYEQWGRPDAAERYRRRTNAEQK